MATEERQLLGELASLAKRNDNKSTTSAGLPVYGDVRRVGFD